MTRKAERATNIRRLTAAEMELLTEDGAIVDESLPAKVQAYISKSRDIPSKERFAALFGELLGVYRDQTSEPVLPVAGQVELLDESRMLLDELQTRLQYLPPLVTSYGALARFQSHRESFDLCRERLNVELHSMAQTIDATREHIVKYKGHSGEKPSEARDRFFLGTLRLLPEGLTNTVRARVAGELLALAGVPVPQGEKELLRLAAKVGKIAP